MSWARSPAERSVCAWIKGTARLFSRAGENYHYGGRTHLEVGNTEVAAAMISSAINVDVYKIEAADPYPVNYQATVERNVREQNEEARPEIAGRLPAVESYDTVLLG